MSTWPAATAEAMRILRADACTLEPLTHAHAGEMFPVLCDPAIYEFENEPPPSEAWLTRWFKALERRASKDGTEQWLNWAVRTPGGDLAGYVQATVLPSGAALVAYVLASRFWGQGIGSSAVAAMLEELRAAYQVRLFVAVLKAANYRSVGLLRKLAFHAAADAAGVQFNPDPDEIVMTRHAIPA